MTWQGVHERARVLAAVLARAEQRRDGLLPQLGAAGQPPVFASPDELLVAVFRCWQHRLLARLDAVVEREDGAACVDVAREVAAIARQSPGLSAIVATHLEVPALSCAWQRCSELVAMATGVAMEVELAGQLRGAVAGLVEQRTDAVHAPSAPTFARERPVLRSSGTAWPPPAPRIDIRTVRT